MAAWLGQWIANLGVQCLKPLGGSNIHSTFQPSKVDQMSDNHSWGLSDYK